MTILYGVLNHENSHADTSNTLRGAKNYATRNGYRKVSVRHGYNVVEVYEKVNGKWIKL